MKIAAVLGSAKGWLDEYEQALAMLGRPFDAIYCVKITGIHWPGGPFIWAGLHPEFMDDYEKQRAALGYHKDYEIVAPPENEVGMHGKKGRIARRVSYRYLTMTGSAGSGGYAAKVALDDGNDKVVLCGVPMTMDAGHFTRGQWKQQNGHMTAVDSFKPGFENSLKHFRGRVVSMSGWTRDKLGAPTPEWLHGA
jgi:hypothetical protein